MESASQSKGAITDQNIIAEALQAMRSYRSWSHSTYNCYRTDCELFENFMYDNGLPPKLENVKLHLVNKWILEMKAHASPSATINRRLASLSSIFSFYMDLGITKSNPFKAAEKEVGNSQYHSALLEISDLREVFRTCKFLKTKKMDIELTVKMLFFSGLRNQALTSLKVKDVLMDLQLLKVTPALINSKNKPLVIPIPPHLFNYIKEHIEINQLQADDTLLSGLNGQPLQEKQLNRITNRINRELNWVGEKRVTPHGFRSSLATLLSERGVDRIAIKIVLGHSDPELEFQENVWIYIRKHKRFINQIHKELTAIEAELEDSEFKATNKNINNHNHSISDYSLKISNGNNENEVKVISEEILLHLLQTQPKLAMKLIEDQYLTKMAFN